MNIKYLKDIHTLEELKSMYRKYALKLHPDRGGSTEEMQILNAEYEYLFERVKNIHKTKEGKTYTSRKENTEKPYEFINLINEILHFNDVHIEVIGSFVWCTGNTKPYRTWFKENGFRWHSVKLAWYLAPEWYVKMSDKQYTMDEIRDMYGVRYEKDSEGRDELR